MPHTRLTAIAAGVFACLLGTCVPLLAQARTLVDHDFAASTHGWLVSGDSGAVEPQLHVAGGQTGGYISYADEALGETWYFRAPDSVLDALRAAGHATLSYTIKQSAEVVGIFEDDVVVAGPEGRLSYRFRGSPGTEWTSFAVEFTAAAGWRWNWNAPATQEQIRRVLATATSLEIRGEYHTGPDEGALDRVVIGSGR